MGQESTFEMNLGWICIDFRVARESSACCGVNLAFAGFGGWWGGSFLFFLAGGWESVTDAEAIR
jgi:hypothetical protein